jgi:uroporphyrinogen-III synthase
VIPGAARNTPGFRCNPSPSCAIVASIGPTKSEAIRQQGLPVDIDPEVPKLGHLIAALPSQWRHTGKAVSQERK